MIFTGKLNYASLLQRVPGTLLLLCLFTSQALAQSACGRLFTNGEFLAGYSLPELLTLAREHFPVIELEQVKSTGVRRVILLGETHYQNSTEALSIAEELLNRFSLRALEWLPSISPVLGNSLDEHELAKLSPITLSHLVAPYGHVPATNVRIDLARDTQKLSKFAIARAIIHDYSRAPLLALVAIIMFASPEIADVATDMAYILFANSAHLRLDMKLGELSKKYEDSRLFKYLLSQYTGMMTLRERDMATEINHLPENETALVITGAAHVNNIAFRLTRDFGFK